MTNKNVKKSLIVLLVLCSLAGCGTKNKNNEGVISSDLPEVHETSNDSETTPVVDNQETSIIEESTETTTSYIVVNKTNSNDKSPVVTITVNTPVSGAVTQPVVSTNTEKIDPTQALLAKIETVSLALDTAKENLMSAQENYDEAKFNYECLVEMKAENDSNIAEYKKLVEDNAEILKVATLKYEQAEIAYAEALSIVEDNPVYKELIEQMTMHSDSIEFCRINLENARNELDYSESIYKEALQFQKENEEELTRLAAQKAEIEQEMADVEKAKADLAKLVETKALSIEECETELMELGQHYDEVYQDYENAYAHYLDVVRQTAESEKGVAAYYAEYLASVERYNEAASVVADGSVGFFMSHSTEESVEEDMAILEEIYSTAMFACEDNGYEFLTEIGNEDDATSLENMKRALELIAVGNQYRATDDNFTNREELTISDGMMLLAQIEANQEKTDISHWYDNIHAQTAEGRGFGENSAWGYTDPFDGWYVWEKENYETQNGDKTGHYTNLMNDSYTVTGLGCTGKTYVQDFTLAYYEPAFGKTYSYDEYYQMFMNYYNAVTEEKAVALDSMNAAFEAYTNALENGDSTDNSEVEEAQAAYIAAQQAVDDINCQIDELVEKMNDAYDGYYDTLSQYQDTEIQLDYLELVGDNLNNEISTMEMTAENLNEYVASAKEGVVASEEYIASLESELAEHETLYAELKVQVEEFDGVTAEDYEALAIAESERKAALVEVTRATNNDSILQGTLDSLNQYNSELETVISDAEQALNAKEAELTIAEKVAIDAEATLTKLNQQYTELIEANVAE